MKFDVLIVGGGAAGTAAGINLARANRNVCIIDDGNPRNRFSEHAHGILGVDAVRPLELLKRGHQEFESFGGTITRGRVEKLSKEPNGDWTAELSNKMGVSASNVLIATGITDELPQVPGLSELWGKRVFHCPYCHGYEVRGKDIAIVGGENPEFTYRISCLLTKWARSVTLFLNGMELPASQHKQLNACGVSIASSSVETVSAVPDDNESIEISSPEGCTRFEACFTGPKFIPNDALLRQVGCAVSNGWVKVENGKTSQPGIWAVGNVVSSPDQVSQAAGAGAAVAIAIDQAMFDNHIQSLLS
ncbi:FAD-dependent pyridine nucleotide-disulfide oxidoreductase [Corynebacterium sp. HMSC061H03]|uniref:NAD(P)/FAD-dependent oxidoreductase n=1 Tax=Corynebacterium sp. HMSC061H03 TaxID=1739291 RepID=UPI0008A9D920|nr:NAD(P)/FAD-dependent oxidoreductase [Corynebacterium sp. HMSC061H03]OHR25194.1 FAD-dependent pyridine nucleotide-disulfide oxidoreductase [Corynebacterium sp. HMSC061H03]